PDHVRQHPVEDDQIRISLIQPGQRLGTGLKGDDVETLPLELVLEGVNDGGVIVDEHDSPVCRAHAGPGNSKRKVDPRPSSEVTLILAPWRSAMCFTIHSPSPNLPRDCARSLRTHLLGTPSAGLPIPVSAPAKDPGCGPDLTCTDPPAGVNLTAFSSRLSKTWSS